MQKGRLVRHGFVCLRPAEKFADAQRLGVMRWWGIPRAFCLDCWRRAFPEEHRYQAGDSWRGEGKLWIRCQVCEWVKEKTEGMERKGGWDGLRRLLKGRRRAVVVLERRMKDNEETMRERPQDTQLYCPPCKHLLQHSQPCPQRSNSLSPLTYFI